jgi:hypothetical protein
MFLDHTQRRTTVGRTPLDERSAHPEESYQLCCVVVCDLETSRICAPYMYDMSSLRVKSGKFKREVFIQTCAWTGTERETERESMVIS